MLVAMLALTPVLWGATCRSRTAPETGRAGTILADIESVRDCAPERYEAAKILMERAGTHMRAERPDQAEIDLLAARRMVERAKWDCEKLARDRDEAAMAAAEQRTDGEIPAFREEVVELTGEGSASLVTVYFEFDSALLSDEACRTLQANAETLRRRANLRIRVEGHCDERGGTEYNLALGERRARAVKNYLVRLGILPERLEVVSYGKERPAEEGHDESAWARNRRSEFQRLPE
jgi:peptidoglycan-associated lipoprotein